MPYENQYGSKTAHSDIIKNPDVQAFLKQCQPIVKHEENDKNPLTELFETPPSYENSNLPKNIIASDGSMYTSSIDDRLPSIKTSFLKFSTILIELAEFGGLEDPKTHFIDPFKVASLFKNKDCLTAVLPISNLKLPDDSSVRDSFRRQVETFLSSTSTRFNANDSKTSLLNTLIELALLRPNNEQPTGKIKIHKCPQENCEQTDIYIAPQNNEHFCPACKSSIYISDCLRIWEAVNDFHPNQEAVSRFMSYVEHLLPIHYLRFLRDFSPAQIGELALLVDGPLAVFGNAAWLHRCVISFLNNLSNQMRDSNQKEPLIIGLQKSGYVVEYMGLLQNKIPRNSLFILSDDFRYKYLGIAPSKNGFGYETYYGQDFIFKTPSGKLFVFALPYPFDNKSSPNFIEGKTNLDNYPNLIRALRLITEVETDLYKNAIIPIALAHKYAAISFNPGGRVLDILGRKSIK